MYLDIYLYIYLSIYLSIYIYMISLKSHWAVEVMQLKTTTIKIEQSQLTGESQSVTKEVAPLRESEGKTWVIQERPRNPPISTRMAGISWDDRIIS